MWVPEGKAWRVPSPMVAMQKRDTSCVLAKRAAHLGEPKNNQSPSAGVPGTASPEGRTSMHEAP